MDHADVVRALTDPRAYPYPVAAIAHLQTHISHVFVAGPYVYKLKKAVRFPFLDFGTAERRRWFCEEEVRLNRRLCPAVYLGVVPIGRDATGGVRIGGDAAPIEHAVWMRRLPADRMLVDLLAAGRVGTDDVDAIARVVAGFHAAAPTGADVDPHGDPEVLRARWEEEARSLAAFVGTLLPAEDHELLADFGPTFIRRHETLLRARQRSGRIREGHGDLHAANVALLDAPVADVADRPPLAPGVYVFDCIEFSRELRCGDVASEVAFLAMDVDGRGRPDLARRLVETYTAAADDPTLDAVLPFYACQRACVRGKVDGLESAEPDVDPDERAAAAARARAHFAHAVRWAWEPGGPAVIACAGLSGTGKSTLAAALGAATGFDVVSSDAVRRRTDHPSPTAYDAGAYTPAARAATYDALSADVETALAAGRGVIADATFIRAADRRRLAAVARRARVPWIFVECRADESAVRARLGAREGAVSPSDARWDTYVAQRDRHDPFAADEPHVVVDTSASPVAARAAALRVLWRWRQGRPV